MNATGAMHAGTPTDEGDKTRFTLHHVGLPGGPMHEMCAQSWNESFDKLAQVVAEV